MMADKHGIIRLTRVAHVRGLRLARAAEEAKQAHDEAVKTHVIAVDFLEWQQGNVNDARTMFARDPACPQGKLWLDHNLVQLGIRAEAVVNAEANAEIAEAERTEAVRAVARHQARCDRIAEHHKGLLRADRLQAEVLAELDTAIPARAIAL
jgi:hypothetical protein